MQDLIKLCCDVCGRVEYTSLKERINEKHGADIRNGEIVECEGHYRNETMSGTILFSYIKGGCSYEKCEHKLIDPEEDSFVKYISEHENAIGDLEYEGKFYHLDCYLKKHIELIPKIVTLEQLWASLNHWSENP